ncbi:MAG: AfsR/SARP family transcriptional regulator [Actinomycetota bacterium]|nr:AfsR/SARP family transcriptional regulator [Actinomycetota bacterium]
MSFHILGPVTVILDGSELKITAPRQRALLANLLINANQTMSTSKLIDGLWGGSPPQHPESALHIVVSRLRRALDVIAPRLIRDSSGYWMELDPAELDLTRARTLLADAQRAMRVGDAAHAAVALESALACWTGEALADVASFPFGDVAFRQLQEFRLGLVELRNAAYLNCGRHLEVLEDIDTWIRDEPWRERLRAHQMVALYRSGRQIDALAAYEALRRLLCTDFGIDPCDDLKRLHGRILRRDPQLLDHRRDTQRTIVSSTPDLPRPADRRVEVELLVERLREVARVPSDVVIVEGGPGAEKAWLVVEVPCRSSDDDAEGGVGAGSSLQHVTLVEALARCRALVTLNELTELPLRHLAAAASAR